MRKVNDMVEERKMKVTKQVMESIKQFSKNHGIQMDALKKQFEDLYFGVCSSFDEESGERAKQSLNVMKAQLNSGSAGMSLDGIVLYVSSPKAITVKKGTDDERVSENVTISGIFKINNVKTFIKVTAWDDAIEIAKHIPIEKIVRLSGISSRSSEQYGIQYTFSRSSSFQILSNDEVRTSEIAKTIFGKYLIDLEEADTKPSKDSSDLRMIRGRVKDCYISASKTSGNVLGTYRIFDDDTNDDDLSGDNSDSHLFTVKCDPSLAKCKPGSLCYFIGTIKPPQKEYSASMWAELVMPIFQIQKPQEEYDREIQNAKAQSTYIMNQETTKDRKSNKKNDKPVKEINSDELDEFTQDVNLSGWD